MATSTKSKRTKRSASGGMPAGKRNKLPAQKFAFPKERKEPLNDAKHVRNAIARFDQVEGVSDAERESAWRRITRAAKKFGVEISERSGRGKNKSGRAKTGRAKTKKSRAARKGS